MHRLIHDWNVADSPKPSPVMPDDDTPRDGLQSQQVCPA